MYCRDLSIVVMILIPGSRVSDHTGSSRQGNGWILLLYH